MTSRTGQTDRQGGNLPERDSAALIKRLTDPQAPAIHRMAESDSMCAVRKTYQF
jgi:hypothetical protein